MILQGKPVYNCRELYIYKGNYAHSSPKSHSLWVTARNRDTVDARTMGIKKRTQN